MGREGRARGGCRMISTATPRPPGRPAASPPSRLPGWASALLVGGTFTALVALEVRRPLRTNRTEPKLRRTIRNMAVAAVAAAAVQVADAPVTTPLTRW